MKTCGDSGAECLLKVKHLGVVLVWPYIVWHTRVHTWSPTAPAPARFKTPVRLSLVKRTCKDRFETGVLDRVSGRKEAQALYRIVTGSDEANDTSSLLETFMNWQESGCLPCQFVAKVHLKKNCIVWTTILVTCSVIVANVVDEYRVQRSCRTVFTSHGSLPQTIDRWSQRRRRHATKKTEENPWSSSLHEEYGQTESHEV